MTNPAPETPVRIIRMSLCVDFRVTAQHIDELRAIRKAFNEYPAATAQTYQDDVSFARGIVRRGKALGFGPDVPLWFMEEHEESQAAIESDVAGGRPFVMDALADYVLGLPDTAVVVEADGNLVQESGRWVVSSAGVLERLQQILVVGSNTELWEQDYADPKDLILKLSGTPSEISQFLRHMADAVRENQLDVSQAELQSPEVIAGETAAAKVLLETMLGNYQSLKPRGVEPDGR